MNTKKITILIFGIVFFLMTTIYVTPEVRILTPDSEKPVVTGHCYILIYLNGYLEITRSGLPLIGQKLYMDNLPLISRGGGTYSNATSNNYNTSVGKTITIKWGPKKTGRNLLTRKTKIKPVVLGTYKISGYVRWTSPLPGATISLISKGRSTLRRTLRFTWNHFGAPFRARVKIRNMTTNSEIFNRAVPADAERIDVPVRLFKRGDNYQFSIGSDGVMGKFKMTKAVAKRSKIEFFYNDINYVEAR